MLRERTFNRTLPHIPMNIEEITGLEDELASKAEAVHSHPTSDVTGLVEALSTKASIDHTHDLNDFPDFSQAIGNFAPLVHGHTMSQITDLAPALANKSNTGHKHPSSDIEDINTLLATRAPASHSHGISDVTDLQNALNAKSGTDHTHSISQVASLQSSLDGKANSTHFHQVSEVTGLQDALNAAGRVTPDWAETDSTDSSFISNKPTLGTAAALNVGTTLADVAAGSHTHDANQITSGVFAIDRIPVIPGTQTIVASGTAFSSLTTEQQALIVSGSNVVLSDGKRYVYTGTGDKTLSTNYISVSAGTVDYSEITNTPGSATASVSGLMSASDKTKLDGVAAGATAYVHPTTDGNLHVPATGTNNNGRVLKAGATAGTFAWGPLTASEVGAASSTHSHGNLTSEGRINTTVEGVPVITGPNGAIQAGTSTTFAAGTHTHGSITSDGKMSGVTARSVLLTGSDGTINTLSVGTSNDGKLLRNNGSTSAPSWEALPSHTHGNITNEGAVGSTPNRVLVTGTGGAVTALSASGTSGQVLVSKGTNASPAWEALPASQTSVANLTGGNNGTIAYQSAASTTAFLTTAAVPANDPQGQLRHSLLRSGGQGVAPNWLTAGSIVTKNQGEYVATDATTGQAGTITKIQRITAQAYTTITKEPSTLYVVVG